MKKHNFKKIQKFLEEIEWMFELNNWERHLIEVKVQPEDENILAAQVIPDMNYKEITIKIYPHFWTLSLDLQRKTLLHELVHTTLQNTKMCAIELLQGKLRSEEEIKNINEKTVSSVTSLLDKLLTNNLRYAKKAYRHYLK